MCLQRFSIWWDMGIKPPPPPPPNEKLVSIDRVITNKNSNLWMFLPLRPSNQLFPQPVTCKYITILGIQFAYISSCYVGHTSSKLSYCEEQSLFKRYA